MNSIYLHQTQTFSNVLICLFRHLLLPIHSTGWLLYGNKHVLLLVSHGVCFFPRSCLDTMLKSTTTTCLSWNRPLTRLLGASSALSSLTCLKKLSTCWCIMTGKDTSNICSLRGMHSYTHPNKNVYKLACWGLGIKTNKPTQRFLHTPIHTMSIHTELYISVVYVTYVYYLQCFLDRFKVFADYEDYIKCQEKVNALYKVWALKKS